MFSQFVLNLKYVRQIPFVVFRPKMGVGSGIDQLSTHADTIAGSLNRAFQNMRHTQSLSDFAKVGLNTVFVLHHRRATDDFEISNLGQIRQDLILNAISEVSILLVIGEILEWEHGDTFLGNGGVLAWQRAVPAEIGRLSNGDPVEGKDCDKQGNQPATNQRDSALSGKSSFRHGFTNPLLALVRQGWVSHFVIVKIYEADLDAVFHFTLANLV